MGFIKEEDEKLLKSHFIKYRTAFFCALIQWIVSVFLRVDRAFFQYSYISGYNIAIKIFYLILLMLGWCFAINVFRKIRDKRDSYVRAFNIFCFYALIMLILLLVLWPGIWALDDIKGLEVLQTYESLNSWQHILTGIYQDVLLQILPFPGGIILIQNIIIAICVAYIITKLEIHLGLIRLNNVFLDYVVKLFPFMLFPVLSYQFSGYRMGIYVYLEAVMLVVVICDLSLDKNLSWDKLVFLIVLTAICSTWRSESFFYLPCVCVLIICSKGLSVSKKRISIVLLLFLSVEISSWQKLELMTNNYKIVSLCRPCVELIRSANEKDDSELLSSIGKVINTGEVYKHPDLDGERLYWDYRLVKWYSEDDYNDFMKAFIGLSLKYPEVVIVERMNVFKGSIGIKGSTYNNIPESAVIFDVDNSYWPAQIFKDANWILNRPLFEKVRKCLILFLGCRNTDGRVIWLLHILVWNALPSIIILVFAWIITLIKKSWRLFLVASVVLIKIPIVILLQPSSWFMYFLSIYFLGYIYLVFMSILKWYSVSAKCKNTR